jgi:phosphatidylinositol-3,4,5-trisphosphate 3-phosphatase/dual-specificity protein phosphatase PTEN
MEMLMAIVSSIDEYLSQDPKNVAVFHCVGGKGRTGTVIACYLLYSGMLSNTQEAMTYFAVRRSSTEKGVTQPSQIRYGELFAITKYDKK